MRIINNALNQTIGGESGQKTLSQYFSFSDPIKDKAEIKLRISTITQKRKRPKANRIKTPTWITKMMWVLTGPIIVWPGYQDMPMPEKIKDRINRERMILITKDESLASEPETMWYMSTASLVAPMPHHWVNVFLYLTRKHMLALKTPTSELPEFLKDQIILERYMEEEALYGLRSWIFKRSFEYVKSQIKSI